jgi:NitT/TauT family transport system substrate-binding protein
MALDKMAMKPDAVERIAAGGIGSGLTALQQGGVLAAPIMDPIWAKDAAKYRVLFYAKDLLPQMTQTVGITTSEFIKSNPDKLKAIIAGRRAGVDHLYAHPTDAAASLARAYGLDPAIAEISVRHSIDIQYWSPGAIDRQALEAMVQGLRLIGDVEGPVDWAKLIDARFLPADLQAGS